MNIHKSMGPDEMHLKVLGELADVVAKPLSDISKEWLPSHSLISQKLWQSGVVPGNWKKGNIIPIFKKGKKMMLGTANLPVSPLYWEISWNRSSGKLC